MIDEVTAMTDVSHEECHRLEMPASLLPAVVWLLAEICDCNGTSVNSLLSGIDGEWGAPAK
jgi:hypothetical protein